MTLFGLLLNGTVLVLVIIKLAGRKEWTLAEKQNYTEWVVFYIILIFLDSFTVLMYIFDLLLGIK